ncbi:DNA-3-methyladenine glycosylase 2 [Abyssisolibacter fermentans]|uniref:DNA-3-methyladenine glycosylase 2 n=1 Tax=Abyssisolibacter fermentans TaxID=1766203 RepID=UPI00082B0C3E|nr:DNA-3-methyladenine glycosylase [Abyssisolibacter fermentans]
MKFIDCNEYIKIEYESEFNFDHCMVYLDRSDIECMHRVKDNELYKLIKVDNILILFKVIAENNAIKISFLNTIPTMLIKEKIARYVWSMFDLDTDIQQFYDKVKEDKILKILINRYRGLRIIKINDLFEGLCWAIIGQQINLKFAYTLKKRLVEKYGEKLTFEGINYFIFPTPDIISQIKVEDLRKLQFTKRKSEYLIGVAKLFDDGTINKQKLLLQNDYKKIHNVLTSIRGIGNWTADYTILKCLNINCAFPIADAGIHNALKIILNTSEKPTLDEIRIMSENWQGWEAYATFYIWRYLYD